jgi:hypothetical protein
MEGKLLGIVPAALEALDEPDYPLDQADLRLSETAYEVAEGGNLRVIFGDLLAISCDLPLNLGMLLIVSLRRRRQLCGCVRSVGRVGRPGALTVYYGVQAPRFCQPLYEPSVSTASM